jgi:hypothetical protein
MNEDFDTKIELQLTVSADVAIELLSKAISTPHIFWFSKSYMEGPIYEGVIKEKQFKIWTKIIRRGPPSALLRGQMIHRDGGSRLEAFVTASRWMRYCKVSPPVLGVIGFLSLSTVLLAVMEDTKYLSTSGWSSGIFGLIYCIGIAILLANFFIYIGKGEKEDLENFVKDVFLNHTSRKDAT